MPFPEVERIKYKKNPLIEVICQLRFPSILRIQKEIPYTFQEMVTDKFPIFQQTEHRQITIHDNGILEDTEPNRIYKFASEDETKNISFSSDFISFTDYDYQDWDGFKQNIELAFNSFAEIYKPSFFSRVGLRYKNVINENIFGNETNIDWCEYIKPQLSSCFEGETKEFIKEFNGRLLITLEGDIGVVNINYGLAKNQETKECGFLIDNDFFTAHGTKIREMKDVITCLETFKRKSHNCFRWYITPELEKLLEPE